MSKRIGPKCRLCRRENTKLMLKGDRCQSSKCAMIKRAYAPGVHGIKGTPRLTEYGIQLREKQKAKRYYGVLERQFRNYYDKAINKGGNSIDNFIELLECRFDNVIYNLGFAKSRSQARELVNHGHFAINGKKVNIPSYQVGVNEEITLRKKSETNTFFKDVIKEIPKAKVPEWLNMDAKTLTAKMIEKPSRDKVKHIFDPKLILEFYSR
jgi:small subunit ribosomal protein S4